MPEERRRLVRLRCYIEVKLRMAGKKTGEAVVVEMGVDGLRLRTREKLEKNQEIFIEYPHPIEGVRNNVVRAVVAWSRMGTRASQRVVGARFDDSQQNMRASWVKAVLKGLGIDERTLFQRRGKIRVPGSLPCSLVYQGELVGPAKALNLGVGGALLRTTGRLNLNQVYHLRVGPDLGLPSVTVRANCLTSKHESGESWVSSVQFQDIGPDELKVLGKYLLAMLKEGNTRGT